MGFTFTKRHKKSSSFALKRWNCSYDSLLELSNMASLANRRLFLKQCQLYSILNGLSFNDSPPLSRAHHYPELTNLLHPSEPDNLPDSTFCKDRLVLLLILPSLNQILELTYSRVNNPGIYGTFKESSEATHA